MLHKHVTSSWVRSTDNFVPAPELGRPPGGSSPVIHFFRESETGARWIGKCGQVPLRDKDVIEAARRFPGFLGVYADEILEKLGLAVYQMLGTEVPESALSYQQVTMEAMHPDMLLAMQLNAEDEGKDFQLPRSPRMHYLSRFVDEFQPLNKEFVEHYLANAKMCGNDYVKIQTRDGEILPLKGLGSMLAAADFVYDLDCLGDSCGNAGYVIREDRVSGERYAKLVKIDAGYAFSYSDLRTDQKHNPRDRQIRVAPNQMRLQFADLAPVDQNEFAATAKRILAIPYEEFAHLFAQTEELKEGIAACHWQQLLDELIARKSLFLKAFAPETDRTIINEIETAQSKIAKNIGTTNEELSARAIEDILAQEKEEAEALTQLRVRLAVIDTEQSEAKKVGECKTFQLPVLSTHFVGREPALAKIVSGLGRQHGSVVVQTICGIGGVGKTQLALKYAQSAANGACLAGQYFSYEHIIWLNAETFLGGQFQALAEVFLNQKLIEEEAIVAVYAFLKEKHSLIVFDNVENARSVKRFLPPPNFNASLHILITSRNPQWGEIPTIKLDGFNVEESEEYVGFHLGVQPKEAVATLVDLVEGLPLAISQAVFYIKAGHCTLEKFAETFYLNQANLLSHDLLVEESHPKTIGTTLTLSLAQAKVCSPVAEKMLGFAAYMSPAGIQVDLLKRALRCSNSEAYLGIKALEGYSLISYDEAAGSIRVHRLVQEVMRHRHKFLSEPHGYWDKVVELLKQLIIADEDQLEAMYACAYAIDHVQQVAKLLQSLALDKEREITLSDLLECSGKHQSIMGHYHLAKDFDEQVFGIRQKYYSYESLEVAVALGNLGIVNGDLGSASRSKELLKKSLRIKEELCGPDNPVVTDTLEALANAYGRLGRIDKKRELLERALIINTSFYGVDHPCIGKNLVNISAVYGKLGNSLKQKELAERALAILEKHYGSHHIAIEGSIISLSNAYSDLKNPNKQKELLERVLLLQERHYGPDHHKVALTLVNLGGAYIDLGEVVKAKEILERSLFIKKRFYGANHTEVANALINLANVYGDLGEVYKRKELLESALVIKQTFYGDDHIEIAPLLFNLAAVYGGMGNSSKHRELLEKCLHIQEKHYGFEHPEVAHTLISLGMGYGLVGDVIKQKEFLERGLFIKEKFFGAEHVDLGAVLTALGGAYMLLGSIDKAKELMERAISIYEKQHGMDSIEALTVLQGLGRICFSSKQYSAAKRSAQRCYQGFLKIFGENNSHTQRARNLLNECEAKLAQLDLLESALSKSPEAIMQQASLRINDVDEKFTQTCIIMGATVIRWIKAIEVFVDKRDYTRKDMQSVVDLVGTALKILKGNRWDNFIDNPESYGVDRELATELNMFKEANPVLLNIKALPESFIDQYLVGISKELGWQTDSRANVGKGQTAFIDSIAEKQNAIHVDRKEDATGEGSSATLSEFESLVAEASPIVDRARQLAAGNTGPDAPSQEATIRALEHLAGAMENMLVHLRKDESTGKIQSSASGSWSRTMPSRQAPRQLISEEIGASRGDESPGNKKYAPKREPAKIAGGGSCVIS